MSLFSGIFGKKEQTSKEIDREVQRDLKRQQREIEKEKVTLERREKQIIAEIKKAAAKGQNNIVKIMAKDLIQVRKSISRMYETKANLNGIGMKTSAMRANETVAKSMESGAKAMAKMGQTMSPQKVQQVGAAFERENAKMELTGEIMDDTIDDAMGDEGDEEDADEILSSVLDEIGVDMTSQMANAPSKKIGVTIAKQEEEEEEEEDDDVDKILQERLRSLKA